MANKELVPLFAGKVEACDEDYMAECSKTVARCATKGVSVDLIKLNESMQFLNEASSDLLMCLCIDFLDNIDNLTVILIWVIGIKIYLAL
jgi:hypothetical protein